MTVCKFPEYINRYTQEIELISKHDKENAPDVVYNVAAAMAVGHSILGFNENTVLVQGDDKPVIFDAFNNPKDLLGIIHTGEYVISGNSGALPSALLFPENKELKKEHSVFRVHSFSGIEAYDHSLERALLKCVLVKVLRDIDYRLTQNEVDIEKREIERMKSNPYKHENPYK